ncbi:MAG: hypothetical protein WCV73_01350 [Patescibacteria group bacterium]|jgi:hypothetical protein
MLLQKLKINQTNKFYFILFFWAILLIGGAIFFWPQIYKKNIIQTLRIEKVYGADRGDGMPSGTACSLNQQCPQNQQCYMMEPVFCNNSDQCSNCDLGYGFWCGNWQGEQASGFCYAQTATYPYFASCGSCGLAPAGGGNPEDRAHDCFTQNQNIIENPSYKFVIYNPAGAEKAYITAEGYLFMTGNGVAGNGSVEYVAEYLPEYIESPTWYCDSPAGVFRINDSQGVPVAAFVACDPDGDLTLFLSQKFDQNNNFEEFAQGDYNDNGSGNLVIKNGPLSDLTSAWFSADGVLHLKACYAHP